MTKYKTYTMKTPVPLLLFLMAWLLPCKALLLTPVASPSRQQARFSVPRLWPDAELVKPDTTGITELSCLDTADRMQRIPVPVSASIHPSGQVGISFAYWPAETKRRRQSPVAPVFLIHGFDSSCLEYRRLGPRLAAQGIDTYAVDLLGWGYSQLEGVATFSAHAKIEALNSAIASLLGQAGQSFYIAGASLGGASAIEVAAMNENCQGLILIDAQGFVDGIGPMSALPKPLAKLGVEVLKSVPLRSSANQMSYYDKERYATDEAVVVGRLHCLRDGWSDALVSFMQSGGFSPSTKVPMIQSPALVLWGRNDEILNGNEFANEFVDTLPSSRLKWIEECGHVPHLEQPDATAEAIKEFVMETMVSNGRPTGISSQLKVLGVAGAAALAAFAADWLPVH